MTEGLHTEARRHGEHLLNVACLLLSVSPCLRVNFFFPIKANLGGGESMRVVVVGASSGLGRCIAVGLGRRGADVALLAGRSERLETAAAEIGSRVTTFACDVTDEASCKSTIARVADEMGGIDALVYCPGI